MQPPLYSFIDLILENEDVLIDNILAYAKQHNYVEYTSTLKEAWRISISGLSASLVEALKKHNGIPQITPNSGYGETKISSFATLEAQKHRKRGISLGLFLGLMTYYEQAYLDLLWQSAFPPNQKQIFAQYIKRYFTHIELEFVIEWSSSTENQKLRELQEQNKKITNEKNKYLTLFESIYDPVILLDKNNNIDNFNHRAAEEFLQETGSGKHYYGALKKDARLNWLRKVAEDFNHSDENEIIKEKTASTTKGPKTYLIKFKKMMDVSEKYAGSVIIFNDITIRLKTEKELSEKNKKLEYYAYTDPMTKVYNRRTGLEKLETKLDWAQKNHIPLSVCYFDIDGLKKANDTYGHAEGDSLINFVSSTAKLAIREEDCISRMGGDEFLIIFPNCTQANATSIVQRILGKLEEYDHSFKKEYKHSFSYGIIEVPANCHCTANEVLKKADETMYEMKTLKKSLAAGRTLPVNPA